MTSAIDMNGKTVIVTGAASGIGRAVAERMSRSGAYVLCCDLQTESALSLAEELREAGHGALGLGVDITNEESVATMARRALEWTGRIDSTIANAAIIGMIQPADLGTVVARHEITGALVAYCGHLDRMNLAALAALFTEDCTVIYGEGAALEAKGRRQLEQSLARMWRWKRTAHHLSNVKIKFLANGRAESESHVHAWHETQDGQTATIFGRYLDSFVYTSEGWLISQRRMDMNGSDAGFKVAIPPAPRQRQPAGWSPPEGFD